MLKILLPLLFLCTGLQAQLSPTRHVNPFIGTGAHGHTFPGAVMPFGMVQLSPDTRLEGWDGCSGYHYSDNRIYGFSHTHLSGTGVADYADVLLKPLSRAVTFDREAYASPFDHAREEASPGYYAVYLEEDDVRAELTVTPRVGFHRYTFAEGRSRQLILDLTHRDEVLEAWLEVEPGGRRISGMRRSRSWARDQRLYFVMEFDQPVTDWTLRAEGRQQSRPSGRVDATDLAAALQFDSRNAPLLVKVAISQVSAEGAAANLEGECPGWDFDLVRQQADLAWDQALGKIKVKGGQPEHLTNFYTALYHCMIHPSLASDFDGRYRGMDGEVHHAAGYDHYTVFSLWDTYRALHPLLTILDKRRTNDFIRSMLSMYRQSGRLPVWELAANETNCMIGYHAVSVILDAYQKNIRDWDVDLALEAMVATARAGVFGLPVYARKGFLEIEDESESVSKTLEYAYNDWCIAELAKLKRKQPLYEEFLQRSVGYRHLLDRERGMIRPRTNGGWLEPFDPREVNNHYTEANAWQYTFYAPHDLDWLREGMGGDAGMEKKLDELFESSSSLTGRQQSDITGLIGQYAHGNEPSHHVAYLYAFTGSPWKTQDRVSRIMELYQPVPEGLPGNEDCGQMSAWYVFSALGFYPVTPGSGQYVFGAPLFEGVTIELEDNQTFEMTSDRRRPSALFIQDIYINRELWASSWFPHHFIRPNVHMEFRMAEWPEKSYARDNNLRPRSSVIWPGFVQVPAIEGPPAPFREEARVRLTAARPTHRLLYTVEGTEPGIPYEEELRLSASSSVFALAIDEEGHRSPAVRADFHRVPHDWTLDVRSAVHTQYTAGGPDALIDGLRGDTDWRKGRWQGYQGQNLDIVLDLGERRKIRELGAGFLQDTRAWIVLPREVTFSVSKDGVKFKEALRIKPGRPVRTEEAFTMDLAGESGVRKGRYVRIQAQGYGPLPEWHPGAGGNSYIFIDEIFVR